MPGERLVPVQHPATESNDFDAPGSTTRVHECDSCGATFEGTPAGAGLLVWTRGDEVRYEEPPLCQDCANRITLGALAIWAEDEEG